MNKGTKKDWIEPDIQGDLDFFLFFKFKYSFKGESLYNEWYPILKKNSKVIIIIIKKIYFSSTWPPLQFLSNFNLLEKSLNVFFKVSLSIFLNSLFMFALSESIESGSGL